ncbi:MAG: V-type ATPase subunit [Ruminococcus sp.]|nr:V-type ATPase subunit [Ruminococcus sp.]
MNTSYAVYTRAKAKYGKRLKEKDYKALLNCESVPDVMSYLKSNTHYINAFGEANERGMRRGLFESLLRQYQINEFDTLCRYELSVGEDISAYVAHKTEISEIIRILTMLNSREKRQYNFTVPAHIAKKTSIDLNALAKVETFEQFLEAVKKTRYSALLSKYNSQEYKQIPITEIESELYSRLYIELYKAIDKSGNSDEKSELKGFLDTIIDYRNFLNIIRLKKYYDADAKTVKSHLIPFGNLKPESIDAMCNAETAQQVYDIMAETRVGKLIDKVDYDNLDELEMKVKYKKARHNMYYSDSPSTVMISYIILCEIELHNLICLTEGARYRVDNSVIELLLIY